MVVNLMIDLETWGTEPGCDIRSIGACVFWPDATGGGAWATEGPQTFYIACDNPIIAEHNGYGDPPVRKYPLHRDPKTVQWWSEQSDAAQAAFADPVDLREALQRFTWWLEQVTMKHRPITNPSAIKGQYDSESGEYEMIDIRAWGVVHDQSVSLVDWPGLRLWSHGAATDGPWLAAAYRAVGLPVPWHYRAPRDTRTAFDMAGIEDHSAWLDGFASSDDVAHHALSDAIVQARAVCAAFERNRTHAPLWNQELRRYEPKSYVRHYPHNSENCPGHISDPKTCVRCGTHIDELRPD